MAFSIYTYVGNPLSILKTPLRKSAEILERSDYVIVLTGSGVSAESGIDTFRGEGGIWESCDPAEYATIQAFQKNPSKVWRFLKILGESVFHAEPNAGHFALAEMEARGIVKTVITQNIDSLHLRSGSRNVLQFHGSYSYFKCLMCGVRKAVDESYYREESVPGCSCGYVMKPDVVLFGEAVPYNVIDTAVSEVRKSDCLMVIGTSAEVAPASRIPFLAKDAGAAIIEINPEKTPLTEQIADVTIAGKSAKVLPLLLEAVK